MSRPAVFLDRDGLLIENQPEYVRSWSHVEFLPGSIRAIQQLNASCYVIVMVTNQSVVGRGIISLGEAMRINQQVVDDVAVRGGASADRIQQELGWQPSFARMQTIVGTAWSWRLKHPAGYEA